MRSILNRILDALSGPSTLFGRLYGYWEPPEGWERTTSTGQQVKFEHAELGILHLTQEQGFDNIPVYVVWDIGQPANEQIVKAQRDQLMQEFLPGPDWIASPLRISRSMDLRDVVESVHWKMRRKTWNEILGG